MNPVTRRLLLVALFAGIPLVLAASALLFFNSRYQPYGTRLLNPRPVAEFKLPALVDHTGQARSFTDFRGKVTLVFFGFVNCPDVCPTTMLELGKVYKALAPRERERVQVLLVSVDPDRDTRELLGKYVTFFDPSFLGLTGPPDAIAATAKSFGVFYQKSGIKSAKEYNVDHTATVFAIDPAGNLRLIYGNGRAAETERVVGDVRWLLRG